MSRKSVGWIGLAFLAGAVVGPWMTQSAWAQFRAIKTTSLVSTDLGTFCDGKEVTVDIQDYGVGTSGRHYHPAYSFSWVIEGSQTKTVQGRPPVTIRAGELMTEAPLEVSETVTAAPAKVLLFRIAEKGKPITVRMP